MKKILLLFTAVLFLGCQTMPKGPGLMDPKGGIDTESGKVHILYPNLFSGGSKVLAGKTYSIPGRNDGYVIMVEGLRGIEVVRAIATLTPIAMTEVDFSKVGGVFKEVNEPAVLTRDLNIVAKKTGPSSRGEGLIRIEIRE